MSDSTDTTIARVAALYRYPVKGMTGERLARVTLNTGATMPFDRAYAIENGPTPFDPANPKYLPKAHFVMLMRNEQLASIQAAYDDVTHTLTLIRNGNRIAGGDLRTAEGRGVIEEAVAAVVTDGVRGPFRIVTSPGHSFSDVAAKCLHIVNLASVRALEAAIGAEIDPLRFRPNVIIDGLPAWAEFDLIGTKLKAGNATLDVFKRTERCAATNVNPRTAARDIKIPSFLSKTYGHTDFGVYARVSASGEVNEADQVCEAAPRMI